MTLGGLEDEIVASVTCGSRHTIVVTEDGEAFSFGLGHFGVLGRSFTPFDYDADAAVVAFTGDHNEPAPQPPEALAEAAAAAAALPAAAAPAAERDYAAELVAHLDLIANLSLDDSSDQCRPKLIDSLKGIKIVGASAGHRHSLLLDENGGLYSFGSASNSGCLGHGDCEPQMYPAKITAFDDDNIRIMQMSAGVDISMAVSTTGDVYAWGKMDGGRIGLGMSKTAVTLPRRVKLSNHGTTGSGSGKSPAGPEEEDVCLKAIDVECGYVHSLIVGVDGRIHLCGGVGIEGEDDGQRREDDNHDEERHTNGSGPHNGENGNISLAPEECDGRPRPVPNFNIWHPMPEPQKETIKKERWKKFGKYEIKGRSKMLSDP